MKLKAKKGDFQVKEVLAVPLKDKGKYAVYVLRKEGTNTLDALRDAARRLGVPFSEVSYCGLKDRHALTEQYVAFPAEVGERAINAKNYSLEFAGFLDTPLSPSLIRENRFRVVVRDVAVPFELVEEEIEDVQKHGFPNYYDVQRFGSARHGKGFVAHYVVLGDYRKALRLLIATPSSYDEARVKRFRKCVEEHWGDWLRCIALAPTPWEKKILEFLSKGQLSRKRLKKALSMVEPKTIEFMTTAFQSFIWNQVVVRMLERDMMEDNLVRVRYPYGRFLFYRKVPWNPSFGEIPFPSPRIKLPEGLDSLFSEVLEELGIEGVEALRTTVKGWIFKSHRRCVKVTCSVKYETEWDKEHPGKRLWVLEFSLPPGSYATMLIRRIFWRELV